MTDAAAQFDVFLSHSSADKPAVETLARRLLASGIRPWLDSWNLIPGDPWQEAIEAALRSCAACAVFIGPSGAGPWQNEEMRIAIDRRVGESRGAFRVIPVLLPGGERGGRSRLPDFLVRATWVEFRRTLEDDAAFHRLIAGIRGREPGPALGQAAFAGECPYRGLQFFDVEHAPYFFGREALTGWLLEVLRGDNRFLAVIGPSGSGKSSLTRAGLVAALRRGGLPGSEQWPVAILRPGPRPLESLALALADVTKSGASPGELARLMDELGRDQRTLHLAGRMALRDAPQERRLVLLADQFEEIFTLCQDEGQRQAFTDNLLYAASVAGGQVIVLLTLRADFYGKCAVDSTLAAALAEHQVLVGTMTGDELQRAIDQPAQLAGCELESGLVQRLVDDVHDQPGGLPLLQHALLELWERRQGNRLTHETYEAIGGVAGALERSAEDAFAKLDEREQALCRRVFLRLTQPGEGTEDTKRRARVDELLSDEADQQSVDAVLLALASPDTRLITTEGEGENRFVEASHEALIRGWPRLRQWIEQDRSALRVQRRLADATREWEQQGRDGSYLYRGARLAEADEWAAAHAADLSYLERAFLDASRALRDQEAVQREAQHLRLRRRAYWLAAALAVALLAVGIALRFYGQAEERLQESQRQSSINRGQALRARSQLELGRNAECSLVLALSSYDLALTIPDYAPYAHQDDVRNALQATRTEQVLPGHTMYNAVAWSPDGRTIAAGGLQGGTQLWEVTESGVTQGDRIGSPDWVGALAFSPDGEMLAIGGSDITLWHRESRKVAGALQVAQAVEALAWHPHGRWLAAGSDDGTIRVWDAARQAEVQALTEHQVYDTAADVLGLAWSPDGLWLASAGFDNALRIWDARDLERAAREPEDIPGAAAITLSATWLLNYIEAQPTRLAWSPDGRQLAVGFASGKVVAFPIDSPSELTDEPPAPAELTKHTGAIKGLAWSGDSSRLASSGDDGAIRLWAGEPLESVAVLTGHAASVEGVAWRPGGGRLASASSDQTLRVWRTVPGGVRVQQVGGYLLDAAWQPGKGVAALAESSSEQGFLVRLWDLESGKVDSWGAQHSTSVLRLAWSPAGDKIATASADGEVHIYDPWNGKQLEYFSGYRGTVYDVAWAPAGDRLAWGGKGDYAVRVWNSTTADVKQYASSNVTNSLAWQRVGAALAAGLSDGLVSVWELAAGRRYDWKVHTTSVMAVAWHPAGKWLASGGADGRIVLWDTASVDWLAGHPWKDNLTLGEQIWDLAWNGDLLAAAGANGSVRVWDVVSGEVVANYGGHQGAVRAVSWSDDGRYLITVGMTDGKAIVHYADFAADLLPIARQQLERGSTVADRQRCLETSE